MGVVDTELLVQKLKEAIDLEAIEKEIAEFKNTPFSSPLSWLKEASDIGKVVLIQFVEVIGELEIALDDKEARQALKDFLDDLFDLPFWAETIDDFVFDWLVDWALDFLKEKIS